MKVILDTDSAIYFLQNFELIEDPLSRILILRSFYDMMLGHRLPLKTYVDLTLKIFKSETQVGQA